MTTYICGYWKIKNNVKNSYNKHYKKLIPKTLNILKNCNIVFFYKDDNVLIHLKKHIQTNNIIYKKISIDSLKTYDLSNDYLKTCKLQDNVSLKNINKHREKGLIHYEREYKKSGENSFRKVFTVWTSKLFLVNKIIDENPFNTKYFAWIDISASRFNRDSGLYTQFYLPNKLFHFGNRMKYYGETMTINASFLIGHKNIWKKLMPLYKKKLELSKNSKYAHDEETILYLIWKDNKDLFFDIKEYKADNLNISLNYGCSFIHIPKCGGTTIEKMLFNNNNERDGKFPKSYHGTILSFKKFYSFFIFTFVRNPYTRIISVFNYYMNNGNGSKYDKSIISDKKNTTLDNFLDLYSCKNIKHLNTQYYYLKNSKNINYIAKFENYKSELCKILKILNCEKKNEITHKRKTKKTNWLITSKFIKKVNKIYSIDFKKYNYKKITLKKKIYYNDFLKIYNLK